MNMNGKRFSEGKARRNGFYLALAVCLVAVGVAAWSTFDAVQGYMEAVGETSQTASRVSDDPEAPRSPTPSARPQAGGAASQVRPRATATPAPAATPKPAAPTPAPSAAPQAVAEEPQEEVQEEPQVPANAPLYEISGELIYPVSSKEVAKAYSSGAPMYSATMRDWRVHTGTDLAAESGEQVLACGNGMVKEAYTDSMLGNVLVIEHGDYQFYYCGLGENFLVEPGDVVTIGQAIGTVTAVPEESADKPHLHLEVRRDSAYLDPHTIIENDPA